MDQREITDEMHRAQADFHALIDRATPDELRRRTNEPDGTNQQLLWHMVFDYLIVRTPCRWCTCSATEPALRRHPQRPPAAIPPGQLRRIPRPAACYCHPGGWPR